MYMYVCNKNVNSVQNFRGPGISPTHPEKLAFYCPVKCREMHKIITCTALYFRGAKFS